MKSKKPVFRITELREKAGLTQLELSRLVGVTENTIANWEKGRSGTDLIDKLIKLIKLCRALNCTPEELIYLSTEIKLGQWLHNNFEKAIEADWHKTEKVVSPKDTDIGINFR